LSRQRLNGTPRGVLTAKTSDIKWVKPKEATRYLSFCVGSFGFCPASPSSFLGLALALALAQPCWYLTMGTFLNGQTSRLGMRRQDCCASGRTGDHPFLFSASSRLRFAPALVPASHPSLRFVVTPIRPGGLSLLSSASEVRLGGQLLRGDETAVLRRNEGEEKSSSKKRRGIELEALLAGTTSVVLRTRRRILLFGHSFLVRPRGRTVPVSRIGTVRTLTVVARMPFLPPSREASALRTTPREGRRRLTKKACFIALADQGQERPENVRRSSGRKEPS
jgi:hypothetical protein